MRAPRRARRLRDRHGESRKREDRRAVWTSWHGPASLRRPPGLSRGANRHALGRARLPRPPERLPLDRLSERGRSGLQTVTDLGQFSRSEVNPLLLDFRSLLLPFRSFLLGVCLLAKPLELFPHFLDGSSEVRKLTGDAGDVLLGCHHGWILSPKVRRIHGPVDDAPATAGDDRSVAARSACDAAREKVAVSSGFPRWAVLGSNQ